MAGGATFAYFQETEHVNGNEITAGTVNITLKNPNGTTATPLNINAMAPRDTEELKLNIKNDGTLDVALVDFDYKGVWSGSGTVWGNLIKLAELYIWDGSD